MCETRDGGWRMEDEDEDEVEEEMNSSARRGKQASPYLARHHVLVKAASRAPSPPLSGFSAVSRLSAQDLVLGVSVLGSVINELGQAISVTAALAISLLRL